ncbi:MAG: HAD family hydrolase [Paracoccaceae bacterium]
MKPGPGMLLAFAKATGLVPSEIVMIGDSIHDLGVAPAAGAAMAVGVLTGPAGHHDLAPYADHVLPSIADLPGLLDSLHDSA